MKHIGTVVFLVVCLLVGLLGGRFFFKRIAGWKAASSTPPEVRPFEGAVPPVRGLETGLALDGPIEQWEALAKHDGELGATWLAVNAKAAEFTGPAGAVALGRIVKAGHDADLKVVLVGDIFSRGNSFKGQAPGLAAPPTIASVEPMLAAGMAAGVDMVALDSGIGESEPEDEKWAGFIGEVKERCKPPICYIADWAAAPRVTWWSMVDYIGIRGPIELTDRADFDLHKLDMSWRGRQDMVMSLSLRDAKPVLFFEVGFADSGERGRLSYEAVVDNSKGAPVLKNSTGPWLAGTFLRLPGDAEEAGAVEGMLRKEWK